MFKSQLKTKQNIKITPFRIHFQGIADFSLHSSAMGFIRLLH